MCIFLFLVCFYSAYGTPLSWKKEGTALGAVKAATLPTQGQKKIDVNTVGLINGQPIYEYDLDTEQDEKPWRKPGNFRNLSLFPFKLVF